MNVSGKGEKNLCCDVRNSSWQQTLLSRGNLSKSHLLTLCYFLECFPEHLLGASDFLPGHQLWSLSSLLSLCGVLPWCSPKPPPALEAACWQGLSAMTGSVENFTAIRSYKCKHIHECICENNFSFALYLPGVKWFLSFVSLRNLSLC